MKYGVCGKLDSQHVLLLQEWPFEPGNCYKGHQEQQTTLEMQELRKLMPQICQRAAAFKSKDLALSPRNQNSTLVELTAVQSPNLSRSIHSCLSRASPTSMLDLRVNRQLVILYPDQHTLVSTHIAALFYSLVLLFYHHFEQAHACFSNVHKKQGELPVSRLKL